MDPDRYPGLGFLAAALFGVGFLQPSKQRTDADRLRDLDAAVARHQAKLAAPDFIAAHAKRERRRLKNRSRLPQLRSIE